MSSVQKPSKDDPVKVFGHAWWPRVDNENQCHVWRCTCDEVVYQAFGSPVPDEILSHPQSFGQMRGERN